MKGNQAQFQEGIQDLYVHVPDEKTVEKLAQNKYQNADTAKMYRYVQKIDRDPNERRQEGLVWVDHKDPGVFMLKPESGFKTPPRRRNIHEVL